MAREKALLVGLSALVHNLDLGNLNCQFKYLNIYWVINIKCFTNTHGNQNVFV